MARKTKQSQEKLYGSTLSWEGWTFRVLSSANGLRWIELTATGFDELSRRLGARVMPDDDPNGDALQEIHEYLRGTRRGFSVVLDLRGTPFQRSVWEAVAAIPYGATTSYAEIASSIGRPRALRAVGQAVGANPVPIVIPCHRVVGRTDAWSGTAAACH